MNGNTLFDLPASRFSQGAPNLADSLAWHASVTTELQRRVVEAREYVSRHSGDRQLLRILDGNPPTSKEASPDAQGQTPVGEGIH